MLTGKQIFYALGAKFPAQRIDANWPMVQSSLKSRGIDSLPCQIAAVATIAVETTVFTPIQERGGPGYMSKLYWFDEERRRQLGNTQIADAWRFRARGYVPLRGRNDYYTYGAMIAVDLVAAPERALEPMTAAQLLAALFWQRKIDELADAGNWEQIRRRIHGGLAGWSDFTAYVKALSEAAA